MPATVQTVHLERNEAISSLLTKSILVVDDDLIVVKTVSAHLKRGGFTNVNTLTDPSLTFASLRQHRPDMLLLDIDMPCISGLELLADIGQCEEFRDVIILMLSAAGQVEEDLSYSLGALGFIKKPAKPEHIIRIVSTTFRIANRFGTR